MLSPREQGVVVTGSAEGFTPFPNEIWHDLMLKIHQTFVASQARQSNQGHAEQ
jgi:hypothetical protein